MNRQQAINYLLSSGFSEEQINTIEQAFKQESTAKNDLGVDCISRADVLKLMQDNWHTHNGDWAMQESMDDIRALPSVTPQEPKMGHWIIYNYPGHECVYCSSCKEEYYEDDLYMGGSDFPNYCPNCGAKMVEPQESEDKE